MNERGGFAHSYLRLSSSGCLLVRAGVQILWAGVGGSAFPPLSLAGLAGAVCCVCAGCQRKCQPDARKRCGTMSYAGRQGGHI